MKHEIISVHREEGRIVEVVAIYGQIQITFQKSPGGRVTETKKSLAPPGQKQLSLQLPKEAYVALKRQVEAIFSGHNGHHKKPPETPAIPPHPNIEKPLKEAWPYNRQIDAYARAQQLTPAKAERQLFLDSIKELAYHPADFPYLHPRERACFEALRQTGIKPLIYGVLGFNRTDKTKDKETRFQFKSADLNAAIRMQQHILDQYLGTVQDLAGETERLDELKSLAGQIHGLVLSWKNLTDSQAASPEELLVRIKDLADKIADNLSRCRNPRKTEARDQAKHLTEPHDSLDRLNPGAQAARVAALLNRLSGRFGEISSIVPIILKRKLALEAQKSNIITAFAEASQRLDSLSSGWTKMQTTPEELRILLGQTLFVLGQASILPYRAQAEQAAFCLRAARRHAENRQLVAGLLDEAKKIIASRPFDCA